MKKIFFFFLVFHTLLWGSYGLLKHVLHAETMQMLTFYTVQSLLVLCYGVYATQKMRLFATILVEVMLFRLSTSVIYAALVLWLSPTDAVTFVLHFAFLYFLYLIFEVVVFFTIFAKTAATHTPLRERTSHS